MNYSKKILIILFIYMFCINFSIAMKRNLEEMQGTKNNPIVLDNSKKIKSKKIEKIIDIDEEDEKEIENKKRKIINKKDTKIETKQAENQIESKTDILINQTDKLFLILQIMSHIENDMEKNNVYENDYVKKINLESKEAGSFEFEGQKYDLDPIAIFPAEENSFIVFSTCIIKDKHESDMYYTFYAKYDYDAEKNVYVRKSVEFYRSDTHSFGFGSNYNYFFVKLYKHILEKLLDIFKYDNGIEHELLVINDLYKICNGIFFDINVKEIYTEKNEKNKIYYLKNLDPKNLDSKVCNEYQEINLIGTAADTIGKCEISEIKIKPVYDFLYFVSFFKDGFVFTNNHSKTIDIWKFLNNEFVCVSKIDFTEDVSNIIASKDGKTLFVVLETGDVLQDKSLFYEFKLDEKTNKYIKQNGEIIFNHSFIANGSFFTENGNLVTFVSKKMNSFLVYYNINKFNELINKLNNEQFKLLVKLEKEFSINENEKKETTENYNVEYLTKIFDSLPKEIKELYKDKFKNICVEESKKTAKNI